MADHVHRNTHIQGKISRCGDELARTALYEAAHALLVRSRKWSSLRAWGMKIVKQRGMARARVAVARKLAVVLHRMWSDERSPARPPVPPQHEEDESAQNSPKRLSQIVPVGTKGQAISLRV